MKAYLVKLNDKRIVTAIEEHPVDVGEKLYRDLVAKGDKVIFTLADNASSFAHDPFFHVGAYVPLDYDEY